MGKSTDIRGDRKAKLIGKLAGWLIRIIGSTLRIHKVDHSGITDPQSNLGPVLITHWHDSIFVMPYSKLKHFNHRKLVVLTSASRDGAILETAMSVFKVGAVRGSSSRRAVAALVALRKAIKAGLDVAITPDGPRGPRHKLQPGVIKMAETTGASIVVVKVKYHNCWRLNTWDEFGIPKPFSKVEITYEKGFNVPKGLSTEEFDAQCEELEKHMSSES